MGRICQARGCGQPASSQYARYCSFHKSRLRRQGDANQRGIRKSDLNPYLALVRARIAKNDANATWGVLDARWQALVSHCRGILNEYESGRAMSRFERQAAQQIVVLAAAVESRVVVETVLAIVMMLDLEPRAFRTDRSFRTQLVRRVVALSPHRGELRFSAKAGKMKRKYKEIAPRTIAVLGQWLAETLGSTGLTLAGLEKAERERADQERLKFREAVAQLR